MGSERFHCGVRESGLTRAARSYGRSCLKLFDPPSRPPSSLCKLNRIGIALDR